jgi:hypothetical protein
MPQHPGSGGRPKPRPKPVKKPKPFYAGDWVDKLNEAIVKKS